MYYLSFYCLLFSCYAYVVGNRMSFGINTFINTILSYLIYSQNQHQLHCLSSYKQGMCFCETLNIKQKVSKFCDIFACISFLCKQSSTRFLSEINGRVWCQENDGITHTEERGGRGIVPKKSTRKRNQPNRCGVGGWRLTVAIGDPAASFTVRTCAPARA